MRIFASFLFCSLMGFSAEAQTQRIQLSFDEEYPAPRYLFQKRPKLEKDSNARLMLETKQAIEKKHFKTCLLLISKLKAQTELITNWLDTEELNCRHQQFKKENKKQANDLWKLIKRLSDQKALFSKAAHVDRLSKRWREASLDLLSWQVKSTPKQGWANFAQIETQVDQFDKSDRARVYQLAGELALKRGNEKSAADLWERSWEISGNDKLERRLVRLRRKLKLPRLAVVETEPEKKKLVTSEEEERLYKRFRSAIKSKDYIAAVEDGIEIINKFPGGKRSDTAAKQIRSVYLALAKSNQEKMALVKNRVLDLMKKADPKRILEWAKAMNRREYFQDALVIAEGRMDDIQGQAIAAQVYLLIGNSYLNVGEFESSEEAFARVVKQYSGSESLSEAMFKLAIVSYRLKKYAQAEKNFSQYLKIENNEDYNLSSHYWLWRSRQKQNSSDADEARLALIDRYPVSYYGIRAILENSDGKLSYPVGNSEKWKMNYTVTQSEYESWNRVRVLIEGSWFDEARLELKSLPSPKSAAAKVVMARPWTSIIRYPAALSLVSEAWEKDKSLVNQKVLRMIYPMEFIDLIQPQAKRFKLDNRMILALIRQESSFLYNVSSWAGALGLMQIMAPTGREVARDIGIRNFVAKRDLLVPSINVKIGTNYIYRLTRAFKGHTPLALAAYNAGIGNIRSWMRNRTDLKPEQMSTADPDSELWMEELPWLETSGYVKNILRNWVVYRYLDESSAEISIPVWKL